MKYEAENEKKFESIRRSAAHEGRLKRAGLCACGRPSLLIRGEHRWMRFSICRHCLEAIFGGAPPPPPAPSAAEMRRAA
jgi:hypothetical protein